MHSRREHRTYQQQTVSHAGVEKQQKNASERPSDAETGSWGKVANEGGVAVCTDLMAGSYERASRRCCKVQERCVVPLMKLEEDEGAVPDTQNQQEGEGARTTVP